MSEPKLISLKENPRKEGEKKQETDKEREILRRTQRRPFNVFRVTAYSADIIKVRHELGNSRVTATSFPSLRAAKWLTFPAFSCRGYQMQPESETMAAHSVTGCAFNVCFLIWR